MIYKVKVSIYEDASVFLRQTPSCTGYWRNYQFLVNQDIDEADFWIVVSKGRRTNEKCKVSPKNVVFISGEPDSVYRYANSFLKQFSIIVAPSNLIKHQHKIIMQPGLMWFLGIHFQENGKRFIDVSKSYDFYKKSSVKKTKLISIISSNLAITSGHQKRIQFVKSLRDHYGDKLDVYGRGFNHVTDKWDAIYPYKYHIVVENSSYPHYWTEKLADAILSDAFPIYYGCTNLDLYFPKNSYALIDIKKPDEAIEIINKVILEDYATKYWKEMAEAKRLLLDKHNLCNLIADICDKLNPNSIKKNVKIKNELSYINFNKFRMIFLRTYFKIKSKFIK
jgi:hypothetical protein